MNLKVIINIKNIVCNNIELFSAYDNAYLFGSSLRFDINYNDIDLLLIYSKCFNKAVRSISKIYNLFINNNFPIDLTILSINELNETKFFKKIVNYYKIF